MYGILKLPSEGWLASLPEQEGTYLRRSGGFGAQSYELVKVVHYPSKVEYGSYWEGYYGVPSCGKKDVSRIQGWFLKLEENK